MLTSSTQLQNRSFQVVERLTTAAKWTKVKTARPKCAKLLFFKFANFVTLLWSWLLRLQVLALAFPPSTLSFDFRILSTKHRVFIIIWWSCWAICPLYTPTWEKNISLNRMPCEIRRSCVRTFSKGPLGKCLGVGFTLGFDPLGLHSHTNSLPRRGRMEHGFRRHC